MCQRNNEPLHGHSPCNYCIAHTPTNCKESSCKLISKSRSRSNHKSKLSALPVAAAFLLYVSAYANASHTSTTTTHRHYRLRQSAFISSPSHHDRLCAPHKEIAPSCDFTGTSPFYATIVKTETDPNPNRSTDKKILLEEKKLKLQSSIHYQPIPYRGVSSTHSHSIKKNGNVSILKAGTSISHAPPIKDGVMNFTIERKLTTAINHALTKKNGNRGIQINGAPSSSLAHQDTLIEISASTSTSTSTSTPPSKKLTISNLWKRRHAQSIDEGIRRERVLSEILDETSNGDKGKTKKKRKSYAAKTIAGLISALAEEATGLEVEVDARNDTPFWKKQIDAVEINFSRLGVRALRMGGLDEALLDMSEDLSPYEKETMADSLSEEAKNTYDEIDLMETPVSVSPVDEVFDRIDTDNSGTLDEEELTRALSISSGLSNYSEKKNASSALSKLVSRLVNLYDTNGDGVVDREEYRKLVDDMTEVRNTQRMKQKEREDKKQERLERKGVVHPLKWMKLATRTFQRWSRKEKQEEYGDIDETVNSNVEQTEISTERDSEIKTVNPFSLAGTRVMATAAQVTGVNFEGAQDISDDPSVMNTMSRVEGSILFKDLKLDLRRLLFGAVPFVKRITPGGPLILEPFKMSLKVSFTKEDMLESGLLDDGLRRLVARALRRRVRSARDLVDGAVFYGRTWNMASREAPIVEVPKLINIEFDSKDRMIITGRAKVQTAPDQPFVENSFKLRTKLGTREDGQFIRLEQPELALVVECPKAWERNIVSACKSLNLRIPVKPEPLYKFFPLVSPIKKTDQDGFNLGDDNRIHSIYVKDNALRINMSAVLRPGRFLGNHYLAFTLPNRTFIITMDRIKELIRTARQNKRELGRSKRDLELSKKKEASDRYNRAVAQALSSSSSNRGSDAEHFDLSYNKELDEDLSFLDPSEDSSVAESEIVANNRPGFFGRFLEGYLEAAREETERERNERLTTAISEFFSPVDDNEVPSMDTPDEKM